MPKKRLEIQDLGASAELEKMPTKTERGVKRVSAISGPFPSENWIPEETIAFSLELPSNFGPAVIKGFSKMIDATTRNLPGIVWVSRRGDRTYLIVMTTKATIKALTDEIDRLIERYKNAITEEKRNKKKQEINPLGI